MSDFGTDSDRRGSGRNALSFAGAAPKLSVMTIYAIPDIHGHLAQLEKALSRIEADGATSSDEVIFLGDYIDRGPRSDGVLDLLAQGQAEGRNWSFLMGNHDRMMLNYLTNGTDRDPATRMPWTHPRFGGATFRAYGCPVEGGPRPEDLHRAFVEAVPQAHFDFLTTLPYALERDGLLFVHAGVRPGLDLADQAQDDLVWIRAEFLDHTDPHPWVVVHGHTALPVPRHFGNHVDLDGGAAYGRELFPAAFDGDEVFLLTATGRQRLDPAPLAPDEVAPWAAP